MNGGTPTENRGCPTENKGFPIENRGFPTENRGFQLKIGVFLLKIMVFPLKIMLSNEFQVMILHEQMVTLGTAGGIPMHGETYPFMVGGIPSFSERVCSLMCAYVLDSQHDEFPLRKQGAPSVSANLPFDLHHSW